MNNLDIPSCNFESSDSESEDLKSSTDNLQLLTESKQFLEKKTIDEIKKESEDLKSSTDNLQLLTESKQFLEKKTIEEIKKESEKKTEDELINLGKIINDKEHKNNQDKLKLEHISEIFNKYKKMGNTIDVVNKIIKKQCYIELNELVDAIFLFESITNEFIEEKEKNELLLKKDIKELKNDITDNNNEICELEDKIEDYWTVRVCNLRKNLVNKNKLINYIYIGWGLSVIHTFIFTYYGFNSYINFWYNVYSILYSIIRFIVLFIPNIYNCLKNYDSTYINIVNFLKNSFKYLKGNSHLKNNIYVLKNSTQILKNGVFDSIQNNTLLVKDNTNIPITDIPIYTYDFMKDNLKNLCNIIYINCITLLKIPINNLYGLFNFIKNTMTYLFEKIISMMIFFTTTKICLCIITLSFLKQIFSN